MCVRESKRIKFLPYTDMKWNILKSINEKHWETSMKINEVTTIAQNLLKAADTKLRNENISEEFLKLSFVNHKIYINCYVDTSDAR